MRYATLLLVGLAALTPPKSVAQELPLDSVLSIPVSSAAKYAQTISEAAASVIIITADDIRRHGYRTLDEMLSRVPGYYSTYDRNYTYLGVRGFSRPGDYNNRVLVLVDGHTLYEGVFGSAPAGTDLGLDPEHIERVEVVNGPGSALYGTGAMLTSINIVTISGTGVDGLRASAGAGSFGDRHATATLGGRIGRNLRATIAGNWSETDGQDLYFAEYDSPATNGGVARNLDWDRHRSVLLGLASGGWGLSAFASARSKGIPTGAFGIDFNDARARSLDERSFVELRYGTAPAATAQLDVRGFVNHYRYAGTYPYGQAMDDDADDDVVGGEARLRWDIGSQHRLLVGTEYNRHVRVRYRNWDPDTVYFDRSAPFGVVSLYAQDEFQLTTRLSAVLGVRHDIQTNSPTSTSPRLALLYHPAPRTTLKLLYGEAFRAPTMYEVTYYDVAAGSKPGANLRPERIRTVEAVWEQRLGPSVFGSASLYHYRMSDLIDTQADPADSLLRFTNVALATSTGATVALNGRFPGGTTAYLSYGYQMTRDGGTGQWLSNSPRHLFKSGASTQVGRHLLVGAEGRYESGRRTVQGTMAGGHLWTGLHLVMSPGPLTGRSGPGVLRRSEFSVTIANLLDSRFSTPGAFEHLQTAIEQDGRSVRAGLSIRW